MTQELLIKDNGMLARVELDTQISTAKAYPRNSTRAIEYATELATMDEETAQSCFYVLPRKEKDGTKKEIKGASIRLAEIVMSAWGNIHVATRIVENDGRHITAEAVAWDLETNVKTSMQNKVSIWFGAKEGKGGYQANADMQTVLSNAAAAKALRNAVFKVIPKALIDRVLEKAMTFSVGDQKTLTTKVSEVVDKLVKMGLSKQSILDYYERKTLNDITPDDLRSLIGIGTGIKEGIIKAEEVFSSDNENTNINAAERVNNLLSSKKQKANEKVDNNTGEITIGNNEDYDKVKKQLMTAKSIDTLQLAADLINSLPEDKQEELFLLYNEKLEKFK